MGLGGHAEVKSVGPLDRFMDYVAGFEDWLRTRVTPKLIPFLPSFVTPNVITSVDFLVVVGFTVAAAWTQFLDSFWLKTFLRVLVVVLFIVFAVLDVLDGDVARSRGLCSRFGAAYDHFIDSMAVPLTATAGCLVTQTPPYLVVANIVLLVVTYVMQAARENLIGSWIEPKPGGCGASLLSAGYILLSAGLSAAARFDVVEEGTAENIFFYGACFTTFTIIPTCFSMIHEVGFPRCFTLGGTAMLCIAAISCTVDSSGSLAQALSWTVEGGSTSVVQFMLLGSCVSVRIGGGFVLHTNEDKRYNGFDWLTAMWSTVLVGLFVSTKVLGVHPFAVFPQVSHLEPYARYLPFIAAADMLVRSFVDLMAFYSRINALEAKEKRG